MTTRARVVILGGGIAGAAVFALITQFEGLEVILLEAASALGSGTTAKNNGRCHSGASGVFSDPPEVTARKQQGSALLQRLPVAWQGDLCALYLCADAQQHAAFAEACAKRGIALDDRVDQIAHEWVTRDQLRFAFLLHEPPFDPVALTDALAAVGQRQGGDIRLRHRAERIEVRGQLLAVKGPEFELEADLVLDLTSKFGGSARLDARAPLVTIDWYRWPIMALPAVTLPALDRVITSMNPDHHVPSVIPHGAWTTFDCKTVPQRVDCPTAYPARNPAPLSDSDQETQILTGVAAFPPLASLSYSSLRDKVRVFYGVQGRRTGSPAESDLCRTYAYPDVPGYLLRNGGLATTAVLDALEAVDEAIRFFCLRAKHWTSSLDILASALREEPLPRASRMIYSS